ncbi:hypothetical protein M422DRAFT_24654 [Sphaerobolus stellatus SS14]|nr:hypothetical protein M422DRAFT_24654 [Sphaerobolus stellatus SS14]
MKPRSGERIQDPGSHSEVGHYCAWTEQDLVKFEGSRIPRWVGYRDEVIVSMVRFPQSVSADRESAVEPEALKHSSSEGKAQLAEVLTRSSLSPVRVTAEPCALTEPVKEMELDEGPASLSAAFEGDNTMPNMVTGRSRERMNKRFRRGLPLETIVDEEEPGTVHVAVPSEAPRVARGGWDWLFSSCLRY